MYLLRSYETPVKYEDNFNRAAGNLDNGWINQGNTLQLAGTSVGLTGANVNLYGLSQWPSLVNTDEQIAEFTIGTLTAVNSSSAIQGVWLRANAGLTNGVACLLIRSATANPTVQIFAPTAFNVYGTAKATSAAFAFSLGDTISLRTAANVYTVYQNGVSRVSWTDTGFTVGIGSNNRGGAIAVQSAGSAFGTTTSRIDSWMFKDSAAA